HISKTSGGRFYSPLVRNIAKTEGITQEELDRIPGTGKDNRVTKNDILNYLKNRDSQQQVSAQPQTTQAKKEEPEPAPKPEKPAPQPSTSSASQNYSGNVEIIEMDRMRKLIAEHMVHSKHTSPHVTSFVEADVTKIVNWRNKVKKQFLDKYNEKITFTPIFIEAIVKAINDYPMINVSVDGDKIIKKNYINIGMATALPSGNLIVPVIKNANMLNLVGLTKAVNDLANRARNNQLKPDEIQDGTFTLTNVGTFGNVMGTPIINQPQVAILATGAIQKKPAVIEAPEGDMIGIRHKMFLSLSYDHRVVDGALGGSFLRRIADYLEAFDEQREI
ncbi:MAG: 2-oxo acid dehydrogenase subunit E2, partial [Bacteroidetes bacterium]